MTYNRCSNHRQLSSLPGATTTWYKNDKNNYNYNYPKGDGKRSFFQCMKLVVIFFTIFRIFKGKVNCAILKKAVFYTPPVKIHNIFIIGLLNTSYKTDKINKELKSLQKKCQASGIFPYEGSN